MARTAETGLRTEELTAAAGARAKAGAAGARPIDAGPASLALVGPTAQAAMLTMSAPGQRLATVGAMQGLIIDGAPTS